MPNTEFSQCDLPIDGAGRIYHLQLRPEELATSIVLVGDPGRAAMIADHYLDTIEVNHEHRGLRVVTGSFCPEQLGVKEKHKPLRVSIITSGMGTSSLEIVLQELSILNEVDLKTRTRKDSCSNLHIIRVGTSGGLQADTELGTPIISKYTIGLDNTGLFYNVALNDTRLIELETKVSMALNSAIPDGYRFKTSISPYVARVAPQVVSALKKAAKTCKVEAKCGVTISNSGFFANQGRDIARIPATVPDIDGVLARLDLELDGLKCENMEMETSFLIHFANGLNYLAGSICPAIANRRLDSFTSDYSDAIKGATEVALLALLYLEKN